ncbi:hypothetical protein UREG_05953 [Uncinocarpus reesii 1704]|uniref:Choline/carnitine acyltransferase domain-containing protein n=1 Tax=Uncinocarpus reesii (strain UAMH 1704) TaxID=336963 RepID=C4JU14_UNCRE|nr:uncharacterized protein UREG_05953 [Uncinocarpus reesii 1704]EEP81111.1 hypothetical protein UREG_05953 [Uncinocarpus reesii 1704]
MPKPLGTIEEPSRHPHASGGVPGPNSSPLKEKHPFSPDHSGVTFSHQAALPKLPIPDLESTCKKYLDSLAPLQSPREHEETKEAVQEFLKAEGPELQDRLKFYASSKTSYIEEFWYDSYLNYDNPVVLNLNPFFLLEDDPTPARNHQATRAASLVVSALSFVRAVRREEMTPDTIRGKPLCMFQYSRLFGTARVPTDNGCVIGQDSSSKHLVVMCRGQFYWFDVLDANDDPIMSEKDITLNLCAIIEDAEQTPIQEAAKGAIGVLSTESRKIWSGLRDILNRQSGPNNTDCLNIVDSALFVVCLDHTEPSSIGDVCGNMLCGTSEVVKGVQIGTCINRWYDKLQIIVCQNGSAGINFEHTGVDGHTVLRFASDVFTDTILRFAKTINGQAPTGCLSKCEHENPPQLKWDWDPGTKPLPYESAEVPSRRPCCISMSLKALRFPALYEKKFHHVNEFLSGMHSCKMAFPGRLTRAVQPHRKYGDNPAAEKINALRKATQKHTAVTKECSMGQGHDRHLYALYSLWQRSYDDRQNAMSSGRSSPNSCPNPNESSPKLTSPIRTSASPSEDGYSSLSSRNGYGPAPTIPAIFNDPGWDKINSTILSTSNCGNPSLRHFGFGPTSGDGFGIGYIIKDDSISICASSKHRQTSRFMQTLESYLLEIRKLLRALSPPSDRPSAVPAPNVALERLDAGARTPRRGRLIRTDSVAREIDTPLTESGFLEDDGMGGYGFFDAGMLLHALQELQEGRERGRDKPSKRRLVGKMLKLNEY